MSRPYPALPATRRTTLVTSYGPLCPHLLQLKVAENSSMNLNRTGWCLSKMSTASLWRTQLPLRRRRLPADGVVEAGELPHDHDIGEEVDAAVSVEDEEPEEVGEVLS